MLAIIVADSKEFRHATFTALTEALEESEVLYLDDTTSTLTDLEHYLYPSLFTFTPPIVRARFILAGAEDEITTDRIKKFAASPTIFIFEELSLSAPTKTLFKKYGAQIHVAEKEKALPKENTLFGVTGAITGADKKMRWFAFREALEKHPIEALLGILYWKVRELAAKEKGIGKYKELYRALITAHAHAWKQGTPLELMIERVILEQ
jgi:hypothetical protein